MVQVNPLPSLMFQVNPLLGRGSYEKSNLFSSKDIRKKLKCRLLQFLFGALRVKFFPLKNCCVLSFSEKRLSIYNQDNSFNYTVNSNPDPENSHQNSVHHSTSSTEEPMRKRTSPT